MQVLRSDLRGDQVPVLAAVGPMQFEVAAAPHGPRVQRAGPAASACDYTLARRTDQATAAALGGAAAASRC